jgi:hypothetical protein
MLSLAMAMAAPAARAQGDSVWFARRLPWYGLPNRELIGDAPTPVIAVPAQTGACAALSDRLEPFARRGSVVLRLTLRVDAGAASVSVRDEAGVALLSKQKTLVARDGEAMVYINVQPGDGPRVIALCNASQNGAPAQVEVLNIDLAKADSMPADDMARVNLGAL